MRLCNGGGIDDSLESHFCIKPNLVEVKLSKDNYT